MGEDTDSLCRIHYDALELQQILDHMKNATIIGGIDNMDWNDETLAIMKEFIEIPTETIITIYFRGNILEAKLNFPATPVYEMTYFIRRSSHVLNSGNFHELIIFGTYNDTVEANVQTLVDILLSPIFFRTMNWPDSSKIGPSTQLVETSKEESPESPIVTSKMPGVVESLDIQMFFDKPESPSDSAEFLLNQLDPLIDKHVEQRELMQHCGNNIEVVPLVTQVPKGEQYLVPVGERDDAGSDLVPSMSQNQCELGLLKSTISLLEDNRMIHLDKVSSFFIART
nr:PREDICTED: uncharacterized protein LOC105272527 [Fopius arisanus]